MSEPMQESNSSSEEEELRPKRNRRPSGKVTGELVISAKKHLAANFLKLAEDGTTFPDETEVQQILHEQASKKAAKSAAYTNAHNEGMTRGRQHTSSSSGGGSRAESPESIDAINFENPAAATAGYEMRDKFAAAALGDKTGTLEGVNTAQESMKRKSIDASAALAAYAPENDIERIRKLRNLNKPSRSVLKATGRTKAGYTRLSTGGSAAKGLRGRGKSAASRDEEDPEEEVFTATDINRSRIIQYETDDDEEEPDLLLAEDEEEFDEVTTERDIMEYAVEQAVLVLPRNAELRKLGPFGDIQKTSHVDMAGLLDHYNIMVGDRRAMGIRPKEIQNRRDMYFPVASEVPLKTQEEIDEATGYDTGPGKTFHSAPLAALASGPGTPNPANPRRQQHLHRLALQKFLVGKGVRKDELPIDAVPSPSGIKHYTKKYDPRSIEANLPWPVGP